MATNVNIAQYAQNLLSNGLGAPILLLMLLSMIILPLPPVFLDLFFTFNIALSVIVLLSVIYSQRPLDFAVFPTVLLVATLTRLALNIASTRVVLLNGHTGTASAGKVIESFGEVVIGGNYAVGLVVFAILIVINFVVVTKGAGRISEVSARFTLDAMPGKQMAIDADLNAGLIDQDTAKRRREEVGQEADFYGAMDGASKFVRGDAIAGILILVINLLGGILIGMLQHDISFIEALENYALLTIGDGLVAQIPSLFLSTAAAIMVTRVSKEHDMGQQINAQLLSNPKVYLVSGAVLTAVGAVPGMPMGPFFFFGLVLMSAAYIINNKHKQQEADKRLQANVEPEAAKDESKELGWSDVKLIDRLSLEVGYRLIPLVDTNQGGELMSRIKGVRKKLTQDLGFLVPAVHIRDNLDLQPNAYRLSVLGVHLDDVTLYPEKLLAINPGEVFGQIDGIEDVDPAFGLKALWIDVTDKEKAQSFGYTVVDPCTVVATHLSQVVSSNADRLLGHDEVQNLLDKLDETMPKLVESLVPSQVSQAVIVKILQNLLSEGVPISDFRTIIESMAEIAGAIKEPDGLTEHVRAALKRLIVQSIYGAESELSVVMMSPELEQILLQVVQNVDGYKAPLEPGLADSMHKSLAALKEKQDGHGQPTVVITVPVLRPMLSKFFRAVHKEIHVLSHQEIPDDKQIRIIGSIGNRDK